VGKHGIDLSYSRTQVSGSGGQHNKPCVFKDAKNSTADNKIIFQKFLSLAFH
jgi:hypothetical protein